MAMVVIFADTVIIIIVIIIIVIAGEGRSAEGAARGREQLLHWGERRLGAGSPGMRANCTEQLLHKCLLAFRSY